jgi:hypothetical protein
VAALVLSKLKYGMRSANSLPDHSFERIVDSEAIDEIVKQILQSTLLIARSFSYL